MKIALYQHNLDNTPVSVEVAWPDFIDFIVNYVEESPCAISNCIGKECPWKSHSRYPDNPMAWSPVEITSKRLASNVSCVTALVLDLDHLAVPLTVPWEHVWHTTHNNREEDRCIRIVLRLSKTVPANEWPGFLAAAVRFLGVPADPTCKDLSRIYYRPSHPQGAPHAAQHVPGHILDVDAVLAWVTSNPLPEVPAYARTERLFHDEDEWNLDSDAVRLAIATIAEYLPKRQRHNLALALGGMLRAHGATMEDARHIIREGFADGGSDNPDARAKTVEHTWSLDEEAAMTGFTSVKEILGEEVAKDIGDCFTDARNAAVVRLLQANPSPSATPDLPTPSATLESIRKRLVRRRGEKRKSKNFKDQVHAVILDALLKGDDLVPRSLRPDGEIDPVFLDGKVVDRDAAIRIAMGLVAYRLPTKTPFDFVKVLSRVSLSKMRSTGETVDSVEKIAERAFLAALGKKVKSKKKQNAIDNANHEKWKRKLASG